MNRILHSHHVGRAGVHHVGAKVHEELNWLFREQVEDFGIDGLLEVASQGKPSGKLIAAQIKSGPSFFAERNSDGFVFRGDPEHLTYWLKHKLPVIVILFDPSKDTGYWQSVTKENIQELKSGWKMTVPKEQTLTAGMAHRLERVADGPPYFQRLAELQLARPWMQALQGGKRLFLEAEQWVNKFSGRCSITLLIQDEHGTETPVLNSNYIIFYPGYGFVEGLQLNFPWAEISLDTEKYAEADYERYEEECGRYDKEAEKTYFLTSFDEWKEGRNLKELRPYEDGSEVASWRLEFTLNDLGEAFLRTDQFLNQA